MSLAPKQICTSRHEYDTYANSLIEPLACCAWCSDDVDPDRYCAICADFYCTSCDTLGDIGTDRCEGCRPLPTRAQRAAHVPAHTTAQTAG